MKNTKFDPKEINDDAKIEKTKIGFDPRNRIREKKKFEKIIHMSYYYFKISMADKY